MEPDLAAAPASILKNPEVSVAAKIKTQVAGPRAAAAAATIIKTPEPVAVGLTVMKMSNNGINLGVTGAWMASRWVIAMTRMMNCNSHIEDPVYSMAVVILSAWTTKEG